MAKEINATTTNQRCRPILFSAQMVRAILEGRKTQTRRIVKPQPPEERFGVSNEDWGVACPYGAPGDRLWVRETWGLFKCDDDTVRIVYKADGKSGGAAYGGVDFPGGATIYPGSWRPSIHMPRSASRIELEITEVRVERVQDITHLDAVREGIVPTDDDWESFNDATIGMEGWEEPEELVEECEEECDWINYGNRLVEPREHKEWERDRLAYACWFGFQRLWDKINGDGSWDANPWVRVITFRRINT